MKESGETGGEARKAQRESQDQCDPGKEEEGEEKELGGASGRQIDVGMSCELLKGH